MYSYAKILERKLGRGFDSCFVELSLCGKQKMPGVRRLHFYFQVTPEDRILFPRLTVVAHQNRVVTVFTRVQASCAGNEQIREKNGLALFRNNFLLTI